MNFNKIKDLILKYWQLIVVIIIIFIYLIIIYRLSMLLEFNDIIRKP